MAEPYGVKTPPLALGQSNFGRPTAGKKNPMIVATWVATMPARMAAPTRWRVIHTRQTGSVLVRACLLLGALDVTARAGVVRAVPDVSDILSLLSLRSEERRVGKECGSRDTRDT